MKAWPKSFEDIPEWRAIFESACEHITIYGGDYSNWNPPSDDIIVNKYIWATAQKLLNC